MRCSKIINIELLGVPKDKYAKTEREILDGTAVERQKEIFVWHTEEIPTCYENGKSAAKLLSTVVMIEYGECSTTI